jgi:hypothetical protein
MIKSLLIAIGFLVASALFGAGPGNADSVLAGKWNLPGPAPHLITHYMPWFSSPHSARGDGDSWRHWNWDAEHARHDPDRSLHDGRRDVASIYYPLIDRSNSNPLSSGDHESGGDSGTVYRLADAGIGDGCACSDDSR